MADTAPKTYADIAASVFDEIVAPDYRAEVQNIMTSRKNWRKIANSVEAVANLLFGMGAILAYAAGFFDNKYLSFAAGCCSTISFSMIRYATYANRESIERNKILDRLLTAAGLNPPPSAIGEINDGGVEALSAGPHTSVSMVALPGPGPGPGPTTPVGLTNPQTLVVPVSVASPPEPKISQML